jgi:MerR family transcriptional regulator, light-induced transcriptional regulator
MSIPDSEHAARFFDAVRRTDAVMATDLVLQLLDDGATLAEISEQVLAPTQVRVGELWESGQWTVADEHEATGVTEAAVTALAVMTSRRRLSGGPRVLLACAEEEWHALPAKIAAAVAAEAGAEVSVLVPSLPAAELHRRLQEGDVDLLALSCTVSVNLLGAARCVEVGRAAGIPVVVGGEAFGGKVDRAAAVGADALCSASELADLPRPSTAPVQIPQPAVDLDRVGDAVLDAAVDRLVDWVPEIADQHAFARARTREDLRSTARYTGAAVLTGDATVLDEYLAWLRRIKSGRVLDDVVLAGAEAVADAVQEQAPDGADMLRAAVERARRSSPVSA